MRSRLQTFAALMILGGCSLAMRGPASAMEGKEAPECTENYVPVIVDGMTAAALTSTLLEPTQDDVLPLDKTVLLAAGAIATAYAVSSLLGARTYKACRLARADWYVHEAIQQAAVKRATADWPPANVARRMSAGGLTTSTHEGYYCVASKSRPELSICTRQRSDCLHARAGLAVTDSEDCLPRPTAWCFAVKGQSRCFTTQHACDIQSMAAATTTDTCVETM
ncbi:MAG TPA: hypothetical protein VFK02_01540 [Kofleriaceae bacterium]|nr:hypothetical protein [Kofleriaceae bacterium]